MVKIKKYLFIISDDSALMSELDMKVFYEEFTNRQQVNI